MAFPVVRYPRNSWFVISDKLRAMNTVDSLRLSDRIAHHITVEDQDSTYPGLKVNQNEEYLLKEAARRADPSTQLPTRKSKR